MTSTLSPPPAPTRADEPQPHNRGKRALGIAGAVMLGSLAVGAGVAIPTVHADHQATQSATYADADRAIVGVQAREADALARAEEDVRYEMALDARGRIEVVKRDAAEKANAKLGEASERRAAARAKYDLRVEKGEDDARPLNARRPQCVLFGPANCEADLMDQMKRTRDIAKYEARGLREAEKKKAADLTAEAQQITDNAETEARRIDEGSDAKVGAAIAERQAPIRADYDQQKAQARAARDEKLGEQNTERAVKFAGLAAFAVAAMTAAGVVFRRFGR